MKIFSTRSIASMLFFLAFFVSVSFAHLQTVFAQDTTTGNTTTTRDSFTTAIETTYEVTTQSETKVTHQIRISNKTPTVYLKQYALTTSNPRLKNITVRSGNKVIDTNNVHTSQGTTIGITFPDDVVGQGKVREFFIEYQDPDVANIAGSVLEVHIPKMADAATFDSNRTILLTPVYFSLPVRVSPQPVSTDFIQSQAKLVFQRPNGEPISAIFGTQQNYELNLRYHLENPSSSVALAQIALPPDTQYQKMNYNLLDPIPEEMKQDLDGNWIASYKVPASSVMVVHLNAQALVSLEPNTNPAVPVQPSHTQADKYWESAAAVIRQKAETFTTPAAIYDHIVQTLSYSSEELSTDFSRLGAVGAFENPQSGVCQEFTDAYIAVARAANIPTRRLVGFAYSQNAATRPRSFAGDVLHSWPEYFDQNKNRWIPIDPTWGNTTNGVDYFNLFDLNHIVFSINGNSSTLPNPAGSYKLTQQEDSKDVDVSISTTAFPVIAPNITTRIEQKKFLFFKVPGIYTLFVTNNTGQAWYDMQPIVTTTDQDVTASITSTQKESVLLPFQTKTFAVSFLTQQSLAPKQSEIALHYTQNTQNNTTNPLYEPTRYTITTRPEFTTTFQKKETYLYLGIGAVICTLSAGSILVYRRKFSSPLRGQGKKT